MIPILLDGWHWGCTWWRGCRRWRRGLLGWIEAIVIVAESGLKSIELPRSIIEILLWLKLGRVLLVTATFILRRKLQRRRENKGQKALTNKFLAWGKHFTKKRENYLITGVFRLASVRSTSVPGKLAIDSKVTIQDSTRVGGSPRSSGTWTKGGRWMCHVRHDRLAATRILLILGLFVQTIQVLANAWPLLGRFAGTVGTGGLPSVHHGPSGHVRHLKHWFSSVKTLFTP